MAIAVRHTVLVGHRERREGNGPKTARQPEDTQGAKAGPERRGRCGPQEETSIRTAEVLRPLLERASPSGSRAGSRGRVLSCRKGEGYGPVREATEGEGRKETHAQAAGAPPWDRLPGPERAVRRCGDIVGPGMLYRYLHEGAGSLGEAYRSHALKGKSAESTPSLGPSGWGRASRLEWGVAPPSDFSRRGIPDRRGYRRRYGGAHKGQRAKA